VTPILLASALFGPLCAPCHGESGRGDGPAAHLCIHPPSDLTLPGRDLSHDRVRRVLRQGVLPMGMPSFAALADAQIDALVEHVRALQREPPPAARGVDWWPPTAQGSPPAGVPYDLHAARCGTCHPTQHEAWRGSRHGRAMGPGVTGQYHGATEAFVNECDGCHAPLPEQGRARGSSLRGEGVTCAACHLRAYRKHGPVRGPERGGGRLPAHGLRATPIERFGRSDFCLPCHNLPLTVAVAGRPLLDTWREWSQSPYLVAGVQCQHCHQPDGDHGFRGAHDQAMSRRAVRLEVSEVTDALGVLTVDVFVQNVGAGHHFPTTATPKAVLCVRQIRGDAVLADTSTEWDIGRSVEFVDGSWRELADTRIPAQGTMKRRYRAPRAPGVTALEVSVRMIPDAFYTGFFEARLERPDLAAATRRAYQAASAESRGVLWLHTQRLAVTSESDR